MKNEHTSNEQVHRRLLQYSARLEGKCLAIILSDRQEGDDYKEGWAEGPILISKNGDTYTLEFSSDYAYMEGQGQDQITVSLKYKGGIGDGTEIWGEYDEK